MANFAGYIIILDSLPSLQDLTVLVIRNVCFKKIKETQRLFILLI